MDTRTATGTITYIDINTHSIFLTDAQGKQKGYDVPFTTWACIREMIVLELDVIVQFIESPIEIARPIIINMRLAL